jgi:hypothetical protein
MALSSIGSVGIEVVQTLIGPRHLEGSADNCSALSVSVVVTNEATRAFRAAFAQLGSGKQRSAYKVIILAPAESQSDHRATSIRLPKLADCHS